MEQFYRVNNQVSQLSAPFRSFLKKGLISGVQKQKEENEKRLFYSQLKAFGSLLIASLTGDTPSKISQSSCISMHEGENTHIEKEDKQFLRVHQTNC